ncbi:MAG: serine acetyltransferase, partial [Lachnospiraceae bacterium]|nr:serine acetyltransferase [Lachnospiraceae bacterium]
MDQREKDRILDGLVDEMNSNYEEIDLLNALGKRKLPDRDKIITIIKAIRRLMFPGYFGQVSFEKTTSHYFAGEMISSVIEELKKQVVIALNYGQPDEHASEETHRKAEQICYEFAGEFPKILKMLLTDVQAGFDGDPASGSKEAIISSYPGFNAIF